MDFSTYQIDKNIDNMDLSVNISDELCKLFSDYSKNVIIGRSLPDVRDGLKPVHRRILYAMYDEHLLSNKRFSKCAAVVGEVLKKYHPHGDMSVYDALVRLAQKWNMRENLIDGQGNFGNIDGDAPAAYRYTEARLTKIAEEMLSDIRENTVDFVSNFDDTILEPQVLPSKIPNLLINGSEGIAVAMATKCAPHNLNEVINAIIAIINEKYFNGIRIDDKKLNAIVPGPDFPTGGIICNKNECLSANSTGKGSIIIRGRANIITDKNNQEKIIINEIPYQVNKTQLLKKTAMLMKEQRINGIISLRDESDRNGMRIVIDIKNKFFANVVLNQLYKYTQLQSYYFINSLAIVDGKPKLLNLRSIINEFIKFRHDVVFRRTKFKLNVCINQINHLVGVIIALSHIDYVVYIIRNSKNIIEAKDRLLQHKFSNIMDISLFNEFPMTLFETWMKQGFAQLSEVQINAVLDIKLSKLVILEKDNIVAKCKVLLIEKQKLNSIISSNEATMHVIKNELIYIKKLYATPRKTVFLDSINTLNDIDLIPEQNFVVTISYQGYIKRSLVSDYKAQRRGGRGKQVVVAKKGDFILSALLATTHSYLLAFTTNGKLYWLKVCDITQTGSQSRGRPIVNFIKLQNNERVCKILSIKSFPKSKGKYFIVMCTKNGRVKKTDLAYYSKPRLSGILACIIKNDDELITAYVTDGLNQLLISTKRGMAIRFNESDIRPMARNAMGVNGIALKGNDNVVSMDVVKQDTSIFTMTEYGYGKRTSISRYRVQNRGGMGVITIKCNNKIGNVVGSIKVHIDNSSMIVTNKGKLIKLNVNDISKLGRNTQGVRLISINKEQLEKVISIVVI